MTVRPWTFGDPPIIDSVCTPSGWEFPNTATSNASNPLRKCPGWCKFPPDLLAAAFHLLDPYSDETTRVQRALDRCRATGSRADRQESASCFSCPSGQTTNRSRVSCLTPHAPDLTRSPQPRRSETLTEGTWSPATTRRIRNLREEFHRSLDEFRLHKGPFLQTTPPYRRGASINGLIADGTLHPEFAKVDNGFPAGRPLYLHQEMAIRKAGADRNLVIATGTGSGKTECYLFPILDYLLRERDASTLADPGVRAMLLYPMNALANDQMQRLRDLLRPFPDITYGRFIGATEHRRSDGEEDHRIRHGGDPDQGELVSREQIRDAPPHILLTNYAMLEYLLLRPEDTRIFDGSTGRHWRFIVLDEMHVYNGARGAEIAMLLRRVRDRVNESTPDQIHFIGTSATLGSETGSVDTLAEYAQDLFGETVEQHSHDRSRRDIITPRYDPPAMAPQWEVPLSAYPALRDALAERHIPDHLRVLLAENGGSRFEDEGIDWLIRALRQERHIVELSHRLNQGPVDLSTAHAVFFGGIGRRSEVSALAEVATRSYGGERPLVPARYHFILRAIEGAFTCQSPRHPPDMQWMFLERRKTCRGCAHIDEKSMMFETGICHRCGSTYLLGVAKQSEQGHDVVRQAAHFERNLLYLLVGDEIPEDDEDEKVHVGDETAKATVDRRVLCTACGSLTEGKTASCACGEGVSIMVTSAKPADYGKPLRRCPACSGRTTAQMVLRFRTGQDAPVAVIATALYQEIPPAETDNQALIGEGRKLLSFADNRQDAAFFAPYLERTYSRVVQRRLLWEILQRPSEGAPRFEDIVVPLRKVAEQRLVLDPDSGRRRNSTTVRHWLMREVLATDRRQSLEGVGLVEIATAVPRGDLVPPVLLNMGFTQQESLDLIAVMIETLITQGVVSLPEDVDIGDPVFAPRHAVAHVRAERPDRGVVAWLPAKGVNRRLDYLRRLFGRRGLETDPSEVLRGMWKWMTSPGSPWRKVLKPAPLRRKGTGFAIDSEWITMTPESDDHPCYWCSVCKQKAWRYVSGICPSYMCNGELRPLPSERSGPTDHYRHLYTSMVPNGMRVEEHTGQLNAYRAQEIQQQFIEGNINTLSGTTTFELGVDVGDVQAVLMRNVPPSPANYIQRAGRAGRRISATALVVSFAQRRNHDLHYFNNPNSLIDGNVQVPIISLRNPLIVRRHVHAVAFAAYQRREADRSGRGHQSVGSFFVSESDQIAPVHDFINWLRGHPSAVGDAVARITPSEVAEEIGIKDWKWVEALVDESDQNRNYGWLRRATNEIQADIADIDREIDDAEELISSYRAEGRNSAAAGQSSRRTRLLRTKNTIAEKRLIDYLATRVVLPKYGFPVDVVALDVWRAGDSRAGHLDLTRDLRIGITDYAPGSRVVADKAIWEPTGLRILPGRRLLNYQWGVCRVCRDFRTKFRGEEPNTDLGACQVCQSEDLSERGTFVVPMFGFVGRRSKENPGETQPAKEGWSEFFFSDYEGEAPQSQTIEINGVPIETAFSRQGQITVINKGPERRGFRVCLSCGYAEPTPPRSRQRRRNTSDEGTHTRPGGRSQCDFWLSNRGLGHRYLTDVLEVNLPNMTTAQSRSVLHAVLTGTPAVGVPTGDVRGTLRPGGISKPPGLIIFDSVPGGAGHVHRIANPDNLKILLEAALSTVADCGCALDTSCYGCLRSYYNQAHHDELVRGDALSALEAILGPAMSR